jgi:glycosyltransferase involved in cell wall biosynthesis
VTGLRIVRYHPRAAVGDGGMTGAVRRWSGAVARLGADVTIAYADGEPPPDRGLVSWTRVPHRGVGPLRVPVGLESLIGECDLLVLHSGWTAHNARAAAVARSHGVPYLLEPRGAYDPHIVARHSLQKRAWWLAAEHAVVDGAVAIHAFFDEERAHLDAIGYHGSTIIAPNGVETPQPVQWIGGGGYLLWAGRYDPEHKGLDLLVNAVADLPAGDRPQIRLHGPDRRGGKTAVERLVQRRDVGRWVRVGPAVYGSDKARLLAAADAFLYPSRWDACPNAVLEAVAIGVPTLCTPYPLGAYLARRGAVVLADASVNGLRDALPRLADQDAMAQIGAVGTATAALDFRWPAVAEQWLAQVDGYLDRRRPATSRQPDRSQMSGVAGT